MLTLWIVYLALVAALLWVVGRLGRPIPARFAFVFGALPIAFCAPGFFGGRTVFPVDQVRIFTPWAAPAGGPRNANLNDVATQMGPWAEAVRRAWREGSLPWRDRWNGCGMALAANGQSAALSPFTLGLLLLPLASATTWATAFKLCLALVGFWLWLTEMERSPAAALLGSVSFAFSLTMTPWLLFPHSSVFCLWPWALFAMERLRRDRARVRDQVLLVAVVAAFVLAGHPESAALGVVFAGLFVMSRLVLGDPSLDRRHAPRRLVGLGLVAAGLTAALWVPQLLAIESSNRYVQAREFRDHLPVSAMPHGVVWGNGLLTSLLPTALGDDYVSPRVFGAAGSFPEMALGYFGIVGWTLVLQVFRPGARDRREWALLVPLVCGLCVGAGIWPLFDLFLSVPLLRLMLWLRFLSFAAIAGSAIAAFELDRWNEDRRPVRFLALYLMLPVLVLGGTLIGTSARFRTLHAAAGGLALQKRALAAALLALGAGGLILSLRLIRPRLSGTAAYLLSAVVFVELLWQGGRLYRWGSPAEVFPVTPLVQFLRSQQGTFRIVGEGAALYPGTNTFAGMEDIRTHDAVERRDYVDFLDRTCGYDPRPYFKHIRDVGAPVLDFLNVRFLVTDAAAERASDRWKLVYSGPDGRVFENSRFLPRVFAPERIRLEGDSKTPEALPADDWSKIATVREHPDVGAGRVVEAQNLPVEVTNYRETTNSVRFVVSSTGMPERPILVTSLVQDGGWRARTGEGKRLMTLKANGVFLGIVLDAGRDEVRLDYSPPGFRTGLLISLAAVIACAGSLVLNSRRRPGKGTR
jgi:hypothetical protein